MKQRIIDGPTGASPCAGVLILHGFIAHRLLSDNPEAYGDALVQGIRDLVGIKPDEPIPSGRSAG